MTPPADGKGPSRRGFLAAASGLAAGAILNPRLNPPARADVPAAAGADVEPFWGEHQSGILTPAQSHTYFAAFDMADGAKRADLVRILRDWTVAAGRMARGEPLGDAEADAPAPDSGETLGLRPARLTVTFGFGPGLFVKDGADRFGLAAQRPAALVELPTFAGDQLVEGRTGGDLSVQACADDQQVAFHAVRQLARLADGVAQLRWVQSGFLPGNGGGRTPRNLMGFKDGSNNPSTAAADLMEKFVWAGAEGPAWMRGGSYAVVRRIRIALEHWDRMSRSFQEQTVGRRKDSGAPLGGRGEFDPPDLAANDKDGNSVIPDGSHIRLAAAESNDGVRILRRSYSYNDGVSFTAERWPPWRQGMEYDAGLLFLCYQRDPRAGFTKIFGPMSKLDMLNQFATHVGGGLFACPPGAAEGEHVGQRLFAT
jgi:deferrochelatase/peroxidase EfeB